MDQIPPPRPLAARSPKAAQSAPDTPAHYRRTGDRFQSAPSSSLHANGGSQTVPPGGPGMAKALPGYYHFETMSIPISAARTVGSYSGVPVVPDTGAPTWY